MFVSLLLLDSWGERRDVGDLTGRDRMWVAIEEEEEKNKDRRKEVAVVAKKYVSR